MCLCVFLWLSALCLFPKKKIIVTVCRPFVRGIKSPEVIEILLISKHTITTATTTAKPPTKTRTLQHFGTPQCLIRTLGNTNTSAYPSASKVHKHTLVQNELKFYRAVLLLLCSCEGGGKEEEEGGVLGSVPESCVLFCVCCCSCVYLVSCGLAVFVVFVCHFPCDIPQRGRTTQKICTLRTLIYCKFRRLRQRLCDIICSAARCCCIYPNIFRGMSRLGSCDAPKKQRAHRGEQRSDRVCVFF